LHNAQAADRVWALISTEPALIIPKASVLAKSGVPLIVAELVFPYTSFSHELVGQDARLAALKKAGARSHSILRASDRITWRHRAH